MAPAARFVNSRPDIFEDDANVMCRHGAGRRGLLLNGVKRVTTIRNAAP